MLMLEQPEPIENLTTWVYEEGSLVPTAKLSEGKSYSIVSDYLGRPAQAYDDKGKLVWLVEFDIYGRIRENLFNNKSFIPFRQLGQYEDVETGLYYNRFRYYNPETGLYISQDPIKLAGNNPNFYAYVHDSNTMVDVIGLCEYEFKDVNKKIQNILKDFEDKIKKLKPNAQIGFRGSASTSVKGPHKGNVPFDPQNFDIDVFVVSDKLYDSDVFSKNDWWRGIRKTGAGDIVNKMEQAFIDSFSGYRFDPKKTMDIRIFKSGKIGSLIDEGANIL